MRIILLIFLSLLQQELYYFYAAQDDLRRGDYRAAMEKLIFCDQLNPKDAKVKEELGQIFSALQKDTLAYDYYKAAFSLDPDNCWKNYWIAERVRCLNANDAKGAIYVQDQIDKHEGRSEYSVYLRMRIGELTGMKWKKLVLLYEEMLSYNPNNSYVLNNYAYGLTQNKGDLKLAEQMSQQAVKREPNNPSVLDTYGWILFLNGQPQLAEFYLRQALFYTKTPAQKSVIEDHLRLLNKKSTTKTK